MKELEIRLRLGFVTCVGHYLLLTHRP